MRKLFLFLIIILINDFIFALDKTKIDNPFDFELGSNEAEIIKNLGMPKILSTFDDNKYIIMYYDTVRIFLWYSFPDWPPFISVTIFSPSLTVLDGIHVGMNYDEAKKKIGEPTSDNDENKGYSGDSHYIVFFVGSFNQIVEITWLYFLD